MQMIKLICVKPGCGADIGPHVADLCLPDKKVIVEFDGPYHDSFEMRAGDSQRDLYLMCTGWRVFRVRSEPRYDHSRNCSPNPRDCVYNPFEEPAGETG